MDYDDRSSWDSYEYTVDFELSERHHWPLNVSEHYDGDIWILDVLLDEQLQ